MKFFISLKNKNDEIYYTVILNCNETDSAWHNSYFEKSPSQLISFYYNVLGKKEGMYHMGRKKECIIWEERSC